MESLWMALRSICITIRNTCDYGKIAKVKSRGKFNVANQTFSEATAYDAIDPSRYVISNSIRNSNRNYICTLSHIVVIFLQL